MYGKCLKAMRVRLLGYVVLFSIIMTFYTLYPKGSTTDSTSRQTPRYNFKYLNKDIYSTKVSDYHINTVNTSIKRTSTQSGTKYYITFDPRLPRRLGNCMSTLAPVLVLARETDKIPVVSEGYWCSGIFSATFDLDVEIVNVTERLTDVTYADEKGAGTFTPSVIETARMKKNVVIKGFLQSWKYLNNSKPFLRQFFRFKSDVMERANRQLRKITDRFQNSTKQPLLVGIHARRGDILVRQSFINHGHTTPDVDYYVRAMSYFVRSFPSQPVVFVVCSNDIAWPMKEFSVYKNFSIEYITERNSPGVDLAILSRCQHTIMSVGTFGWWASWLADGITVYYKNWPVPGSRLDVLDIRREDYFYPDWIPM